MPESKCPITHLSPNSRKKRLTHFRVRKFRMNARLTKAMEKNEILELKSINKVEDDIIQIMRKVGNASKDIITRYKNNLVDGILQEIRANIQ